MSHSCAQFFGYAWFNSAAFCREARSLNIVFMARARFEGGSAQSTSTRATKPVRTKTKMFSLRDGIVDLIDIELEPLAHRSFRRVDFGNTAFLDEAVFDNRDILEPSSFRDCIFMKRASFHGSRLHQGVSFHGAAFDASLDPGSQFKEGAKRRPVFALADHVLKRLREADVAHRAAKGEPAISFKDWLLAFEAKRTAAGERFRALPQKTVDAETGARAVCRLCESAGIPKSAMR
jgi:hypothetical protein